MALEYASDHWAKDRSPQSALAKGEVLGGLPFNRVEWEFFRSLIPARMDGWSVVDFGCGLGWSTIECAQRGARVIGIDRSCPAVQAARVNARQAGVQSRCRFLVSERMVRGQHDVIVAKDVIEHVPDDDGFVRSVAAALKPGGYFIFSTQNTWCLNYLLEGGYHRWWHGNTSWMGWDPTHVRFYNPTTLRRLMNRHGLRTERWASMWIVPYNILSWLSLLKVDVTLPSLATIDRLVGRISPFNRLGWGLMAVCRR